MLPRLIDSRGIHGGDQVELDLFRKEEGEFDGFVRIVRGHLAVVSCP